MKEDFKNIIKQTVDNHSDDINPELIWNGVEEKLRKKKNRFFGYYIMGGIMLLLVALVFVHISLSHDAIDQESSSNIVVAHNDLDIKINNDANVVVEEFEDSKIDYDDSEFENERLVIDKKDTPQNIDDPVKFSSFNGNIILQEKYEEDSNEFADDLKKEVIVNEYDRRKEINSSKEERFMEMESREENIANLHKLKTLDLLTPLTSERNYFLEEDFPLDENYLAHGASDKFNIFSGIEIYSGISIGSKLVSDIDQSYAELRNDSEDLLEQWSAGFRLDLVQVMDFNISSGLKYSMITDKMNKVDQYQGFMKYNIVTSRLVNDAIMAVDSTVMIDSTSQGFVVTTEQFNSQRIISIPIEISFGKRFNKFDFGLGFGVDINYQLKDTHVILDENEKPIVNRVGGKWINSSFSGAVLIGYNFNDQWSLASRVNFRGLTLNDHESISTLSSKYSLYGIELGLKRSF